MLISDILTEARAGWSFSLLLPGPSCSDVAIVRPLRGHYPEQHTEGITGQEQGNRLLSRQPPSNSDWELTRGFLSLMRDQLAVFGS